MVPFMTETASQGSEMWKEAPVSLPISLQNCQMMEIETPPLSEAEFLHDSNTVSERQLANQTKKNLITNAIYAAVDDTSNTTESHPKPTVAAISALTNLLAVVPESILEEPDVDVYYGEIHLEWVKNARRVVLMAFSKDKQPLVHNYEKKKGKESTHSTEKATAESLEKWLRWLNG
jgi:hypothetical protein